MVLHTLYALKYALFLLGGRLLVENTINAITLTSATFSSWFVPYKPDFLEPVATLGFLFLSWAEIKFQSFCVSEIFLMAPRCLTIQHIGAYVCMHVLKIWRKKVWGRERDDFLAPRTHKSYNDTAFLPSTGWADEALPSKPPHQNSQLSQNTYRKQSPTDWLRSATSQILA